MMHAHKMYDRDDEPLYEQLNKHDLLIQEVETLLESDSSSLQVVEEAEDVSSTQIEQSERSPSKEEKKT